MKKIFTRYRIASLLSFLTVTLCSLGQTTADTLATARDGRSIKTFAAQLDSQRKADIAAYIAIKKFDSAAASVKAIGDSAAVRNALALKQDTASVGVALRALIADSAYQASQIGANGTAIAGKASVASVAGKADTGVVNPQIRGKVNTTDSNVVYVTPSSVATGYIAGTTKTVSFSGTGLALSLTAAHGLPYTPSFASLQPMNAASAISFAYVSAVSSSNVTVTFLTAPIAGTLNISFRILFAK